jgi:hypothetical protein
LAAAPRSIFTGAELEDPQLDLETLNFYEVKPSMVRVAD